MRWSEIVIEASTPNWPMKTYLQANCLAMGIAIQTSLGWPLELLYFNEMPVHVVARNPSGGFADVRGPNLSQEQVLDGFKPPVPTWKPSFKPHSADEIAEILDKNHSPELIKIAEKDLARFWGSEVLSKLTSN